MPQMSPMMWMFISLSMIFLLSMMKSNFQKKSSSKMIKSSIIYKNITWKW